MDLRRPSGIIAAPSRAFGHVPPVPALIPSRQGKPHEFAPVKLPAALAFLCAYGVDSGLLISAAEEAFRQAVAPEAALLASGMVLESFYYRCLAHYLGLVFVEGEVSLGAGARYPYAIHSGIAPLDGRGGCRWLSAPRGQMLAELLVRARRGKCFSTDLAITTPSHMSRLLRAGATSTVLWEASLGLANLDPSLSAKAGASPAQCAFAMAATSAASFAFGLMPAPALAFVSLSMTCFFLASIWLRLFAGAASTACGREPYRPRAGDRWLPAYSIVVALHREARVVPHLIAALDAIDYPGIMAQTPQAFLRRRTISIEVRNNLGDSAMPKSVQIEDIDKEVKKLKTNVDENTKEIKKTNRHLDEVAAAVKALEDRVKKLEAGHS